MDKMLQVIAFKMTEIVLSILEYYFYRGMLFWRENDVASSP